jgi:hypothetical protein
VIGIQPVRDVDLIRHAYVLPGSQRLGIGSALLEDLRPTSTRRMLVGTWAAADWAIRYQAARLTQLCSRIARALLPVPQSGSLGSLGTACGPRGPSAERRVRQLPTVLPYAGAPAGTTPSCCIIASMSTTPQCSATRPSSSNRMMSISCTSTSLPVGGMPMSSPW